MKKPTTSYGGLITVNNCYEAEGLEEKLRRITETNEPIEDVSPIIYTDKKNGVMPEYNIKTDRFEVAMEAVGKIRTAELAEIAKSESAGQAETTETAAAEGGQEPS